MAFLDETGLATLWECSKEKFMQIADAYTLRGNCEIEIGSYVGTSAASHSFITYSAMPYALFIIGQKRFAAVLRGSVGVGFNGDGTNQYNFSASWGENSVTLSGEDAYKSMNIIDYTYRYIALIPKGEETA